jgi:hypothetical protein
LASPTTTWAETAATVAARIREHLDAGADHVAIQVLVAPGVDPLDGYRSLAAELIPFVP